jgi:2-keto-4-pentenoate hydratase/2-oxohepta-3-ene-1,7-dioic acid hydratase in catechol pathway
MVLWVRFEQGGEIGFGTLADDVIRPHRGDMFGQNMPTGDEVPAASVSLLPPTRPAHFIGLWNNFHAAAEKQGNAIPAEPLYFLKGANSLLGPGGIIRKPAHYDGRVIYEGELGIVIGRQARDLDEHEAAAAIFGFTCVNDVTALEILTRDTSFAQWTRAKSFDSFGVIGPGIATGLDPAALTIRTLVNGKERQNYPASDMIFPPAQLVSLLSRDMTLEPGDLIACGTSIGAGVMRPGNMVEIVIDGIGTLRNNFE